MYILTDRTPVYNKGRTRIPITADDIIPLRMLMSQHH